MVLSAFTAQNFINYIKPLDNSVRLAQDIVQKKKEVPKSMFRNRSNWDMASFFFFANELQCSFISKHSNVGFVFISWCILCKESRRVYGWVRGIWMQCHPIPKQTPFCVNSDFFPQRIQSDSCLSISPRCSYWKWLTAALSPVLMGDHIELSLYLFQLFPITIWTIATLVCYV